MNKHYNWSINILNRHYPPNDDITNICPPMMALLLPPRAHSSDKHTCNQGRSALTLVDPNNLRWRRIARLLIQILKRTHSDAIYAELWCQNPKIVLQEKHCILVKTEKMPNGRSKEGKDQGDMGKSKRWTNRHGEAKEMYFYAHIIYHTITHLYGIVVETSMVSRPRASRPATGLVPIIRQL